MAAVQNLYTYIMLFDFFPDVDDVVPCMIHLWKQKKNIKNWKTTPGRNGKKI